MPQALGDDGRMRVLSRSGWRNPMTQSMQETAALWQMRLDRGDLSAQEEADLEQWLAADPAHALALAEAGIAWYASALAVTDAPAPAAAKPRMPVAKRVRRSAWQAWCGGMLAACLVGALWVGVPLGWVALRADLQTPVGQVGRFSLPDGSIAVLDTDSAIAINYRGPRRGIELLRGAAYFEVAKDAKRPFVVSAGALTARALGTAYSVDISGSGTWVDVVHGTVGVGRNGDQSLAVLGAGQGLALDARQRPIAAPHRGPSWQRGVLAFEQTSLQEALVRLDRYVPEHIWLQDGHAGAVPVTAVFPVTDARLAIEALARAHHLRIARWPGLIVLTADGAK